MDPSPAPVVPTRRRFPLALQIVVAVALAIPVGLLLGVDGSCAETMSKGLRGTLAALLALLSLLPTIVLKALIAVGAPPAPLAIITAITTNDISGRQGLKMMLWYLLNTVFAISVGLSLSLLLRPGVGAVVAVGALTSSGPPRLAQVLAPLPGGADAPARLTMRDLLL